MDNFAGSSIKLCKCEINFIHHPFNIDVSQQPFLNAQGDTTIPQYILSNSSLVRNTISSIRNDYLCTKNKNN